MPLPLIPIITGLISAFKDSPVGQAKIGLAQNVGEMVSNKTNGVASMITGFSIYQLTLTPDSKFHMAMIACSLLAVTLRDTAHKILVALKELKRD